MEVAYGTNAWWDLTDIHMKLKKNNEVGQLINFI